MRDIWDKSQTDYARATLMPVPRYPGFFDVERRTAKLTGKLFGLT